MSLLVSFYAGAVVTSLFKQTLQQGKKELLVYATIYGTIGSLTPVASVEVLETVVALESIIIGREISLVGRNVDDYRSLYLPSTVGSGERSHGQGVADGTICGIRPRCKRSLLIALDCRFLISWKCCSK